MRVAEVEQIGDLVVVMRALACGRDDHDAARRVGVHDVGDLAVLRGVRHGRAAEFQNFHREELLI